VSISSNSDDSSSTDSCCHNSNNKGTDESKLLLDTEGKSSFDGILESLKPSSQISFFNSPTFSISTSYGRPFMTISSSIQTSLYSSRRNSFSSSISFGGINGFSIGGNLSIGSKDNTTTVRDANIGFQYVTPTNKHIMSVVTSQMFDYTTISHLFKVNNNLTFGTRLNLNVADENNSSNINDVFFGASFKVSDDVVLKSKFNPQQQTLHFGLKHSMLKPLMTLEFATKVDLKQQQQSIPFGMGLSFGDYH